MRAQRTFFGTLFVPERFDPDLLQAILKGLQWCSEIEKEVAHWERSQTLEHGIRLTRRWNGCTISVYPLVAAVLDMREHSNICPRWHLPVQVNGEYVCIVWDKYSGNRYHVDAVASFIGMLNLANPPLDMVPSTLRHHLERDRIGLSNALSCEVEYVLCEALTEQLGKPHGQIIDYIDVIFTDDEWVQLRESFPWGEATELAVAMAHEFLATSRPQLDRMWAIGIIAKYQPANLDFFINHNDMRLAMHAVSSYEPNDAEEAWSKLAALLSQDNVLGLMVHTKLSHFVSLVGRLQQHWQASWAKGPPADGALRHVVLNWMYFNRENQVQYA